MTDDRRQRARDKAKAVLAQAPFVWLPLHHRIPALGRLEQALFAFADAEAGRVTIALQKYGKHEPDCPHYEYDAFTCTCGLETALKDETS